MAQDPLFKRVNFKIPFQNIRDTWTHQFSYEIPADQLLAQPMFDIGVHSFAIARKKTYPYTGKPYKTPYHVFILMLQGKLTITLGKEEFVLKPGMFAYCKANDFFKSHAKAPTWWIYICLFDNPFWKPLTQIGNYVRRYEWTAQMLLHMSNITEASQTHTVTDRLNALENAQALADLIKREIRCVSETSDVHARSLKLLVSDIQRNPEKPWTVLKMARITSLSDRTLFRLFQRYYGMSPMDMVIRKRLSSALAQLINTDNSIKTIASSLNYKSVYSFSNLFMHHVGMRPTEFRDKYHSGNYLSNQASDFN